MSDVVIPARPLEADNLSFFLPTDAYYDLVGFPWQYPLESWNDRGIRFIPVKSGLSRHVVRFAESAGRRFAIKETGPSTAHRELQNYLSLMRLGIPTLAPIGVVARRDGMQITKTKIGHQLEQRSTGYLVTELMEKVIPDSLLFRRGFSHSNRKRIWDAVVRLFVQMHSHSVYWGDASLANMLIKFSTEIVPELGKRTKLTAVLGDAETVEIHQSISDSLRLSDMEFFLESMLWTEADLKESGIVRDPLITQDDQQYLLSAYNERFAVEQEMHSFELVTHIDADRLLGNFDVKGYGKLLLKHIHEHKWYLSERGRREVSLVEAAEDWYRNVFKPVCGVFSEHGLLQFFPENTAASLYVEIMEHKYFMSEKEKRDVGLTAALEDYCEHYAPAEPLRATVRLIIAALKSVLTGKTPGTQTVTSR